MNYQVSEQFEAYVNQWVDLDDTEREARADLKLITQEKKELTEQILEYMRANNLKTINIKGKDGDGTLQYSISRRSASINKDSIRQNLLGSGCLRNPNQIDNVISTIYKNRPVKEVPCLKRTKARNN